MTPAAEALTARLLQTPKYGGICPSTVRRAVECCEPKYPRPKDLEKAVRERLHGIAASFLTAKDARRCEADLTEWAASREDAVLERALSRHISTRERLPLSSMDDLFDRLFGGTRPSRVLDLACGLNPVYLGARGIPTVGVDISLASVGLINRMAALCGAPVEGRAGDLLDPGAIPPDRFDCVLLFKAAPLLERQSPGAAVSAMERIHAARLAVSFPTRTMGGRNVGMERHYRDWMDAHIPVGRSVADRFVFGDELYIILKES